MVRAWLKTLFSVSLAGAANCIVVMYIDPQHFNVFNVEGLLELLKIFTGAFLLHAFTFVAKNPFPVKVDNVTDVNNVNNG